MYPEHTPYSTARRRRPRAHAAKKRVRFSRSLPANHRSGARARLPAPWCARRQRICVPPRLRAECSSRSRHGAAPRRWPRAMPGNAGARLAAHARCCLRSEARRRRARKPSWRGLAYPLWCDAHERRVARPHALSDAPFGEDAHNAHVQCTRTVALAYQPAFSRRSVRQRDGAAVYAWSDL